VATLNGTSNDDLLFLPAGSSGNELLGLEGNDSLDATTGAGNNILRGGDGNDELFALTNDQLFGDLGNDSLYSDGNGSNSLYGGDGNDSLFGDRNDSLFGDAGDDIIYGGIGANKLTGGTGKDIFYITPNGVPFAPNELLDFTQGNDKIRITAIPEVKTFTDLIRLQTGTDTTLRANIGGTVQDLGILRNFDANTLTRVDFDLPPALVNTAPVTNANKTLTLLQDATPLSLGITAPTDVDGDPLTLIVNSIPDAAKGEIRLSDGTVVKAGDSLTLAQLTTLVFAPASKANGATGNFSYSVSDGQGGTATQSIALNITPISNGGSTGDPHIYTFDGLHYDFQATGDFVLVKSLNSDLEVQVRQTPWVANLETTINTGLATVVDGNRVEFYTDQPQPIINNLSVSLGIGTSQALGNGSISRSSISGYGIEGDLYTITYANGAVLKNAVYHGFLIDPTIDLVGSQSVVGLLGNNNGNAGDDLALRDGTLLTNPLAPENLYGAFSSSWQVAENESLFSPIASNTLTPSGVSSDLTALAQQYVFGGNGDDTLIGVDRTMVNPGKEEVDLFMGNKGSDTFVLGDQNSTYYVGRGLQDYALITDFWAEDTIQLHGDASDYVLGSAPVGLANGTGIFLAKDPNDLLGIIQGVAIANLDLSNASMFHYL
jgi:von Willebrand factor type D domain/Bacterial Ig domain/RTX calcium-binding nonapeptide repeat (4 copies)